MWPFNKEITTSTVAGARQTRGSLQGSQDLLFGTRPAGTGPDTVRPIERDPDYDRIAALVPTIAPMRAARQLDSASDNGDRAARKQLKDAEAILDQVATAMDLGLVEMRPGQPIYLVFRLQVDIDNIFKRGSFYRLHLNDQFFVEGRSDEQLAWTLVRRLRRLKQLDPHPANDAWFDPDDVDSNWKDLA